MKYLFHNAIKSLIMDWFKTDSTKPNFKNDILIICDIALSTEDNVEHSDNQSVLRIVITLNHRN